MPNRVGQVSNWRKKTTIKGLARRTRAQPSGPIGMRQRPPAQRHEVRLLPGKHAFGLRGVMQGTVRQHRHGNLLARQRRKAYTMLAKSRPPGLEFRRVQVVDGLRTQRGEDVRRVGLTAFPLVREVVHLALRGTHPHHELR
ncbi:hypothetical protein D3C72_1832530 [compost metagenome]